MDYFTGNLLTGLCGDEIQVASSNHGREYIPTVPSPSDSVSLLSSTLLVGASWQVLSVILFFFAFFFLNPDSRLSPHVHYLTLLLGPYLSHLRFGSTR